jgi:predicted transcriptional regulator
MSLDMVDLVWSLMRDGEFYSPADLANTLGQPTDSIVRILEFLARYKFAERVTKRELIFRKISTGPSPSEAAKILRMLRANAALNHTRQVANISKTSKRLNLN